MSESLEVLREKTKRQSDIAFAAQQELIGAEATQLRVHLKELFDVEPGITGFSWEHESVYDDEGSYFDTANPNVEFEAEGVAEDFDDELIRDQLFEYSCRAWALVCGDGEYEGSVIRSEIEEKLNA